MIGIDVGTSGTKSVLFDTNGELVAGDTVKTLGEITKAACDKLIGEKARQVPNADNHTAYMALYRLYEALYPAVKENFATLAAVDLKG